MTISEKLQALRAVMKANGIDIYVVPTADFHQSEYVGEHFKARAYITGFTGSAGTAVITLDEAGLWTDGRYFLQAGKQLEGTTITLRKMGEPGVPTIPEYLAEALPSGGTLGVDGRVISVNTEMSMRRSLQIRVARSSIIRILSIRSGQTDRSFQRAGICTWR